jgi:5-formaminoimidazole-4-carboxamide-1-beta-D-ribofuranosyl 5'-monophosphate synthetase
VINTHISTHNTEIFSGWCERKTSKVHFERIKAKYTDVTLEKLPAIFADYLKDDKRKKDREIDKFIYETIPTFQFLFESELDEFTELSPISEKSESQLSNLVKMMALSNNLPIHALQGDEEDIEDWFEKFDRQAKT